MVMVVGGFAVLLAAMCYTRTIAILTRDRVSVWREDIAWQSWGLGCDAIATVCMLILAKWQISLHGVLGFIVLLLMVVLLVVMIKAQKYRCWAGKQPHPFRIGTLIYGWIVWSLWAALFLYSIPTKLVPLIVGS